MKDILDSDDQVKEGLSKIAVLGSFSLVVFMIIGNIIFVRYWLVSGTKASLIQVLITAFLLTAICIFISGSIDAISKISSKNKRKKIFSKIFLIKNITTGFLIWLVFLFLSIAGRYI